MAADDITGSTQRHGPSSDTPRFYAIISNKGGVGKTHLAINASMAIATKRNALLIDANLSNADALIKLGRKPRGTLLDYLEKRSEMTGIITQSGHGFDVITGVSGEIKLANPIFMQKMKFVAAFREVGLDYDTVTLDLAPGISRDVLDFALAADGVIVVTTPTDIVSGYACIKACFDRMCELETRIKTKASAYDMKTSLAIRIVTTKVRDVAEGRKIFRTLRQTAAKHLGESNKDFAITVKYLGAVIDDPKGFRAAEEKRQPYLRLFPKTETATGLLEVAARMANPALVR
ncbi:AAA family ATPase [Candidatus Hydrogenedentota bacterium]